MSWRAGFAVCSVLTGFEIAAAADAYRSGYPACGVFLSWHAPNPACRRCRDTRGGPVGHTRTTCRWLPPRTPRPFTG